VRGLKPWCPEEENVTAETLDADTKKCRERRERLEGLLEQRFPKWGDADSHGEWPIKEDKD
jgi:hypothetical protein